MDFFEDYLPVSCQHKNYNEKSLLLVLLSLAKTENSLPAFVNPIAFIKAARNE